MADEAASESDPCLIAVRFDHPLKAQECLLAMIRLGSQEMLTLEDAAIVVKTKDGKIQLQQSKDVNPGQGAQAGGSFGAIIGIIGGPLGMIAGGALGAAVGGLWAKLRDIGIDDDHMREMGDRLNPEEATLFLLLPTFDETVFLREMKRFDGSLFESTCSDELDEKLEACLASEL